MLKPLFKIALILSFIFTAGLARADWAAPTSDPPNCPTGQPGCDIPLNVSNTNQTKAGGLIVGGLRSVLNIFIGDSNTSASTVITDNASQSYFSKRGAGSVIMDFAPEPAAGQYGTVRFFRTTNTTGYKAAEFLKGDGTNSVDSRIGVGGSNSFLNVYGGNVGLGTSAPTAPLNIKRDPVGGLPGWIGQLLIEPVTNNDVGLTLKTTRTGVTQLWSLIAGNGVGNENFRIFNGNGAGDAVNIDTSNNVGIGLVNPASKLDVNGDICWTPPGGSRQCLGSGGSGGGSSFWTDTKQGDIKNTNVDVNTGLPAQVNIQGQLRVAGGAPAANKILISQNGVGLARWANPSEIPGVGLSSMTFTSFSGCTVGIGCPVTSGDSGPTSAPSPSVLDGGTLRMSCPAGYKVVSGGARCRKGWNSALFLGLTLDSSLEASYPASASAWDVACVTSFWSFTTFSVRYFHTLEGIDSAYVTCSK